MAKEEGAEALGSNFWPPKQMPACTNLCPQPRSFQLCSFSKQLAGESRFTSGCVDAQRVVFSRLYPEQLLLLQLPQQAQHTVLQSSDLPGPPDQPTVTPPWWGLPFLSCPTLCPLTNPTGSALKTSADAPQPLESGLRPHITRQLCFYPGLSAHRPQASASLRQCSTPLAHHSSSRLVCYPRLLPQGLCMG